MNCCALNTSATPLFLDHITPLASLLEIPLILNDEINTELTKKYYPEIEALYWPDLEFRLEELMIFDTLIECNFWAPEVKDRFSKNYNKQMRLIFCPHGQSDKGYAAPTLLQYAHQESVLLYGDLLKEMLTDLNLWEPIRSHAFVGNFRHAYYQKHRDRLLTLVRNEVFSKLSPANQTVLYAPTWNDFDDAGTCELSSEQLFKSLPTGWNLILKLHPLLYEKNPALYYRALSWESKYKNCAVIDEIPYIYPILELIDVYLGDYSSIGYDALALRKPMCFLSKPNIPTPRLHHCGIPFDGSFLSIERSLKEAKLHSPAQDALCAKAFSPVQDLKEGIKTLL